ncbi:MAG: ATP-binding protein [Chloroflexi bacterium]|nr:ATP-binding protein [Chloroflexota bacterium]
MAHRKASPDTIPVSERIGAKLYVMVGIPGSGKTWIARHRFAHALRVSRDDLRLMLTGVAFDPRWERIVDRVSRAILETLLPLAAPQGFDVLYDATNVKRQKRRYFVNLARSHGLNPVAVFVKCDLETALTRNSQRPYAVPPAVVRRMYEGMQAPSVEEGFEEVIEIEC